MKAPRRAQAAVFLAASGVAGLSGCATEPHALSPAGEGAGMIANLTWAFVAISAVVFAVVLVLLVVAARKEPVEASPERDRGSIRWIVIGGALIPAVVLTGMFVPTLLTLNELSEMPTEDGLVIEIVGKQWWWEVVYRDGREPQRVVRSANEVHIPAGVRVPVRLTATDVIHSFWVPALQGKMDLIPGRTNRIWLHADSAGLFRGACAEYCGLQHTMMQILVVAHPPAEFEQWLRREEGVMDRELSAEAARHAAHGHEQDRGEEVFMQQGCGYCHSIRGTPARGRLGPDLTHFGSRRTIAAMTLPNNRGNLAGWISNPQGIKPGAKMPRVPLSPDQLNTLVTYLEALR